MSPIVIDPLVATGVVVATSATDAVYVIFRSAVGGAQAAAVRYFTSRLDRRRP